MSGSDLLRKYVGTVGAALRHSDGGTLGDRLRFRPPGPGAAEVARSVANAAQLRQVVAKAVQGPFRSVVAQHLLAAHHSHAGRHAEAFQAQQQSASDLRALVQAAKDENWWLPGVYAVLSRLRETAYRADEAAAGGAGGGAFGAGGGDDDADGDADGEGEQHRCAQEAVKIIQGYFQAMIVSRSEISRSKKLGCLFVVVTMMKIFFKINNLRLCTPLVRSVNSQQFPELSRFPQSEVVSFKYYHGRLLVFDEKYDEAERELEYAFVHCHRSAVANKRRVLQFLVPVKLLQGRLPRPELLRRYGLAPYVGLADGIRTGNLRAYNECLERYSGFFIRNGTYLILEKLRSRVYRTLFMRAHGVASAGAAPGKEHLLSLKTVAAALVVHGIAMDADEVECVLANLIFSGRIKGYIAHRRCVVLSKRDPFPK